MECSGLARQTRPLLSPRFLQLPQQLIMAAPLRHKTPCPRAKLLLRQQSRHLRPARPCLVPINLPSRRNRLRQIRRSRRILPLRRKTVTTRSIERWFKYCLFFDAEFVDGGRFERFARFQSSARKFRLIGSIGVVLRLQAESGVLLVPAVNAVPVQEIARIRTECRAGRSTLPSCDRYQDPWL